VNLKIVVSDRWTFYTPCDADGSSKLYSFLETIGSEYEADKAGLLVKLQTASCQDQGPQFFNEKICHFVDDTNKIFQIRHRTLRLLMFYSATERRAVICSSVFIKRSDKTPSSELKNARSIQQQYETAVNEGRITILPDEED
jgi:hypothetical protein